MNHERYSSPLAERYASPAMLSLWSAHTRHGLWRRLWLALAESERTLGVDISETAIAEMRAHLDDIDFAKVAEYEKRFRHDVMAHVHAFGEAAPAARGVIHLGATSAFVTDNGDLIQMRRGLELLRARVVSVIQRLATFAAAWRAEPALGYTHLQAAQLTTVGKRATLWMQDLVLDLAELDHRLATLPLRGVKGTTGTQASFLELFKGDHAKVRELDRLVVKAMGFAHSIPVSGQTYSRKLDAQVLSIVSGIAASAAKFASDMRMLQSFGEIEEPFEKEQIGSSAMAYKRNPMRSERINSLARFVLSLEGNANQTHSVQYFERTLDDSANRRTILPEALQHHRRPRSASGPHSGAHLRRASVHGDREVDRERGRGRRRSTGRARGDSSSQHCRRARHEGRWGPQRHARATGRGPRVRRADGQSRSHARRPPLRGSRAGTGG